MEKATGLFSRGLVYEVKGNMAYIWLLDAKRTEKIKIPEAIKKHVTPSTFWAFIKDEEHDVYCFAEVNPVGDSL